MGVQVEEIVDHIVLSVIEIEGDLEDVEVLMNALTIPSGEL